MELVSLQILVVVAITQVKSLRTEVGKGSIEIVFIYGLADPKIEKGNLY